MIFAAARAHGLGAPPPGVVFHQIGESAPIAPARTRGAGEPVERMVVDRQPRRRVGRAEPSFVRGIGADQPPGAVGNRDPGIGRIDRGDGDRPVGQRELGLARRSPAQDKGPGQRTQDKRARAKSGDDQRLAADQPHDREARDAPRANRQHITRSGARRSLCGAGARHPGPGVARQRRPAHAPACGAGGTRALRSARASSSRARRLRAIHSRQNRLVAR